MVYSWHSLRDKDLQEEFEEQCKAKLVERMPQVPLTMNLQLFSSMMNTQYVDALANGPDDIVELIKWVSFDIPRTRRPSARRIKAMFGKHRRRQNSLNLLFDRGYLRDGDTLEFIVPPFTSPMSSDATDLKNLTCTVESENGKPYVAWNSENYSITGLTRMILESRRMKVDTEHLNGNTYWRKQGDNQTLFERAEELAREI